MIRDQELDLMIGAFLADEAVTVERQAPVLDEAAAALAGRLAPRVGAGRSRLTLLLAAGLLLIATIGTTLAVGSGLLRLPVVESWLDSIFGTDRVVTYIQDGDIVARNVETGETRVLASAAAGLGLAHSPDGSQLAFLHPIDGDRLGLWVIDADGGNRRLVTGSLRLTTVTPPWFAWSHTGEFIAVPRLDGARIISVVDGGITRVIVSGIGAQGIAWHPDGEHLLLSDRRGSVHLVPIGGGEAVEILGAEEGFSRPDTKISVSADGRYLAVAGESLRVVDLVTGELIHHGPGSGLISEAAIFSPDGRWLAVPRVDGVYVGSAGSDPNAARLVAPAGSYLPSALAFSPDSRQLLVVPIRDGDVMALLVDVESGSSQEVPWGSMRAPFLSWPGS